MINNVALNLADRQYAVLELLVQCSFVFMNRHHTFIQFVTLFIVLHAYLLRADMLAK